MNLELSIKLEDFLKKLENDKLVKEYINQKKKVLDNKELLEMLNKFHKLDIYSKEYKQMKHELFQNDEYKKYLELENKIFYLTLEISQKLKSLTRKKGCFYENH